MGTGRWSYGSFIGHSHWVLGNCVTHDHGGPRRDASGGPAFRLALFPREQVEVFDIWRVGGLRATGSDDYQVTDLFVPEAYSGTREDPALRHDKGPLYAFTTPGLYAVGVAGVAFGIARAMLDAFIVLATEKTPRGLQRLADSAVVQSDVARREAQLGSARAWLVEILKDVWAGADDVAPIDLDARVRVRRGCAHAISSAVEVADYVYKAAGTSGIFPGTPFERRFRDIHTLSQQIQARDAHFEAVGRAMFNGDPDGVFL